MIEEHFRAGNDVTLALRETDHGRDVAIEGNRVVDIVIEPGQAAVNYNLAVRGHTPPPAEIAERS